MIQGLNVRHSVVPRVLDEFLICIRGSQNVPRSSDEPSPGFGSDESFSSFDGGDYCFNVKVGG